DCTDVPSSNSSLDRNAIAILGRAESGLWRIFLADSSGILYVTDPPYDPTDIFKSKLSVTTAWDTLSLGRFYEKITIMNKSDSVEVSIAFGADTSNHMLFPPGITRVLPIPTDTLTIKGDGLAEISIDCINRKRY
ncbi:unnamed protein product, partial [marine sediment metagenome]